MKNSPNPNEVSKIEKIKDEIYEEFYNKSLTELEPLKVVAERAIVEIHKYNPTYIFLTETSSLPSGYLLKEGLKFAYPNSEQSEFYRIDPASIHDVMLTGQRIVDGLEKSNEYFESKKKELEEFFKKRILDINANILVYDADWNTGGSPGMVLALLKNPERFGLTADIKCNNVKMNLSERERPDDIESGYYLNTQYNPNSLPILDLTTVTRGDILPIPGHVAPFGVPGRSKITKKQKDKVTPYNFRARIYRTSVGDKAGINEGDHTRKLAFIDAVKAVGKEIGEKIFLGNTNLDKDGDNK